MILKPREYFTIARGLEDHQDSATYYVRAVVRNARTDTLIETLNLDDKGDGHRFAKEWQVPADTSGEGFYILVVTSVYTDAAYTTKSPLYGDKYDTYLVQDRVNPNQPQFGMGLGPDIDYKKIGKIVSEAFMAGISEEIKAVKKLSDSLTQVKGLILALPKPEKQKEVSFNPVLKAITGIQDQISNLPAPEKIDLSLLEDQIKYSKTYLEEKVGSMIKEIDASKIKKANDDLTAYLDKMVNKTITPFVESIKQLKELLDAIPYLVLEPKKIGDLNLKKEEEKTPAQRRREILLGKN